MNSFRIPHWGSRGVRGYLVASVLVVFAVPDCHAQPVAWSAELPTVERVIGDMYGTTDRETAARRIAALGMLNGVTRSLSVGSSPDPLAAVKSREYEQSARQIAQAETANVDASCKGNHCEKYLLRRCTQAYALSAAMHREVLDRYFSKSWQANFAPRLQGGLWAQAQALPAGTTAPGTLPPEVRDACTSGKVSEWIARVKGAFSTDPGAKAGTNGSISFYWLIPALLLGVAVWWLRPRAISTVAGRIETLGESVKKGSTKRYDYISIGSKDGGTTMIRKVDVPEEVDRILHASAEGVFMVQKVVWLRALVAARVGQRHAIARAYTWSPIGFYLRLILVGPLFVVGPIVISLPVIMFPVLNLLLVPLLWIFALLAAAALVYTAVFYPLWRSQLYAALRAEGIDKLPKTVEI